MPNWTIHQGNVLDVLPTLPSESVHCVVTSPPYWGLRDYGTAQWKGGGADCDHHVATTRASNKSTLNGGNGVGPNEKIKSDGVPFKGDCGKCGAVRTDAQIGLEKTPDEYVARLVGVFREVRRVLRKDGTCWLNLGDSYAAGKTGRDDSGDNGRFGGPRIQPAMRKTPHGLKPKDLVGVPWSVAFALRADGWYLRSDIIWAKPNPMPESVTDRPTKAHEYVFLLSKSARYFYDAEAVNEPSTTFDLNIRDRETTKLNNVPGRTRMSGLTTNNYARHNIRSVWNIATQPFPDAHFATFPERLVDRCISAGTSEKGVCVECGQPYQRVIERVESVKHNREASHAPNSCSTKVDSTGWRPARRTLNSWVLNCGHAGLPAPATVLDPFCGSGTTGVVATRLGRNFIGIELNPEYVAMANNRIDAHNAQTELFTASQLAGDAVEPEPAMEQTALFSEVTG